MPENVHPDMTMNKFGQAMFLLPLLLFFSCDKIEDDTSDEVIYEIEDDTSDEVIYEIEDDTSDEAIYNFPQLTESSWGVFNTARYYIDSDYRFAMNSYYNPSGRRLIFKFNSNGNYILTYDAMDILSDFGFATASNDGTWEIKEDNLVFDKNDSLLSFSYSFSDTSDTLTLTRPAWPDDSYFEYIREEAGDEAFDNAKEKLKDLTNRIGLLKL